MLSPDDDFQVLFEGAQDLLYTQDMSGKIIRVNRAFEGISGYSRLEIVGTDIQQLIASEHQEILKQRIIERIGGGSSPPFEVELLAKKGRVPLEMSIELVFERGVPTGIQGFGRDISEKLRSRSDRMAADEALLRQTDQLATFSRYLQLLHRLSTTSYSYLDDLFAEYLSTGCQIFSLECGAISQISGDGFITRKTCGTPDHLVGTSAAVVLDAGETLVGAQAAGFSQGRFYVGTPLIVAGQPYGVLAFWSTDGAQTHPQAKEMIEMMARGIEAAIHRRRLTEELEFRAKHDSLTGLANRQTMSDHLKETLGRAKRSGTSVAVIFIDLDNLKRVNDTLGHAAGDAVLEETARRFKSVAWSECMVARVGGDEFTAVVHGVQHGEEALAVAERFLAPLVTEPITIEGEPFAITASAGVAIYPEDGADVSTLLRKADAAMYEAKQGGGNAVRSASDLPRA